MRNTFLTVALVSGLSLAGASMASAQGAAAEDKGFSVGTTDVGPVIGVGGLAGAGAGFGGRFETAFKDLPNARGVLGLGVAVDYFHYSNDFGGGLGNFSFSYIPISVTVNYHFRLDNKKIDPFAGAGLGDLIVNTSCSGIFCGNSSSGVYFVGHVGIRYFFRPTMSLFADAGSGYGNLHVGVMFKLKEGE
jgi:hypothetical protein